MKTKLTLNQNTQNARRVPCAQFLALALAAMCIAWPSVSQARIKLITLPLREKVEIQLDHPNVTLVEEERVVPLVQTPEGNEPNQVDFSWLRPRSV